MRKTFKLALKAGVEKVVKLVLMTGQDDISGKSEGGSAGLLTEQAHLALVGQLRDGRLKSGTFLSMPMLVERLGIDIAKVPLTFPFLGNVGPASIPITLSREVDSLHAGDKVLLLGIGSGINAMGIELIW